jgi:hypothetical protein
MQSNNTNIVQEENSEVPFFERPFELVQGGYVDGNGFYCTPEGSFWDENYTYFNREGRDKHGGYYDEYCVYIPGDGWNEEHQCYESQIDLEDKDIQAILDENFTNKLIEEYDKYQRYYVDIDREVDEIEQEYVNKEDDYYDQINNHMNNNNDINNHMNNNINNNNFSNNNENFNPLNFKNGSRINSVHNTAEKIQMGKVNTHIEPNSSNLNMGVNFFSN